MSPKKKPAAKRTARTVYLPPALNDTLISEAERRGLSGNDLVILALEQFFVGAPRPTPPAADNDVVGFD